MTKTSDPNQESAITDEVIRALKSEHPGVELHQLSVNIDLDLFEMVARTPSRAEYDRWREQRNSEDPGVKSGANKVLVAQCRAWPELAAYNEMMASKPGLTDTFAGELAEAAGVARAARRKKL